MATGDLTTLARLKSWLPGIGNSDTSSDALLAMLITAFSRWFKTQVRRDLVYQSYAEVRDGRGGLTMAPYQFPVVGVDSVVVDGTTIVQQPALVPGQAPGFGWVLSEDTIKIAQYTASLVPYISDWAPDYYSSGAAPICFTRGMGNVTLNYRAGYAVGGDLPLEPVTIPGSPYQVQTQLLFTSDIGVTIAGTAATKVDSGPTTGQYAVSATGLYTFAAADTGKAATLSYGYVPADVEMAVIEAVAQKFTERGRIGQMSKSTGNEVVSFAQGMPQSVKDAIERYTRQSI